ncbi:hypothetical protein [Chelativorans sp. J32]|uniref:hypothetical protein n=1 Tax=Chelativorans sp. J32 TaxID=935840 RepID=UPI000481F63A|nr:hypothetical protein [Chelativorans sp. J32]
MRRGSAATVLQAARALFEGAPPSLELLARATGRQEAYLARIAGKEGWREAPAASQEDPETLERRLVALSDQLVGDLEAAGAEGRASGTYDKARIDALSTMLRMVEKLGEMTRLPERAAEKQKRSDAELAAALALVDARILELACELAGTMGGGQAERGDSASDPV